MNTFDLSPLYRTAIGFDRLADMLSNAQRVDTNGYPPYNIESLGEDRYRITMAVAGFGRDELDIVSEQNTLTVSGSKSRAFRGRARRRSRVPVSRALPTAASSAVSSWPITSRWPELTWRTACCTSNCSVNCPNG
jgi:HSP20 family molecular chaperone IbpA